MCVSSVHTYTCTLGEIYHILFNHRPDLLKTRRLLYHEIVNSFVCVFSMYIENKSLETGARNSFTSFNFINIYHFYQRHLYKPRMAMISEKLENCFMGKSTGKQGQGGRQEERVGSLRKSEDLGNIQQDQE